MVSSRQQAEHAGGGGRQSPRGRCAEWQDDQNEGDLHPPSEQVMVRGIQVAWQAVKMNPCPAGTQQSMAEAEVRKQRTMVKRCVCEKPSAEA